MDTFGKVFECASKWGFTETVLYLYSLKRASSQMINRWFEVATEVDVLKLLSENEKISEESVITAFNKSARCTYNHNVKIVKFLYKQECIPSDSIGKSFVGAVDHDQTDVLELLQNDSRLLSKTVDEGFVKAVSRDEEDVATTLYDQHQYLLTYSSRLLRKLCFATIPVWLRSS